MNRFLRNKFKDSRSIMWLLFLACAGLGSCKISGIKDSSSLEKSDLNEQSNLYSFKSAPAKYHGFSWTKQKVGKTEGVRFVEQAAKNSHIKNKEASGVFPSSMIAGNGLYLAQDPFASQAFGNILLAVKIKPNSLSNYAHTSEADFPSGFDRHFLPALLSSSPILHYYWRQGSAFVIRDSNVVDLVDVFDIEGFLSPTFNNLPVFAEINEDNLAEFFQRFGKWVKAFAAISNDTDYRLSQNTEELTESNIRMLIAFERNFDFDFDAEAGVTPSEIETFSRTNLVKANTILRAINLFRRKLNNNWTSIWTEINVKPKSNCKNLEATATEEFPIFGYTFEDMDRPRFRSIAYFEGTVKAKVKARFADVVLVTTQNDEEGYSYLDDWKCID